MADFVVGAACLVASGVSFMVLVQEAFVGTVCNRPGLLGLGDCMLLACLCLGGLLVFRDVLIGG